MLPRSPAAAPSCLTVLRGFPPGRPSWASRLMEPHRGAAGDSRSWELRGEAEGWASVGPCHRAVIALQVKATAKGHWWWFFFRLRCAVELGIGGGLRQKCVSDESLAARWGGAEPELPEYTGFLVTVMSWDDVIRRNSFLPPPSPHLSTGYPPCIVQASEYSSFNSHK